MDMSRAATEDIAILRWLYEQYNDIDITTALTYKMGLCSFALSGKKLHYLDNLLKAIRQDLRKVFLSIKNINEIYEHHINDDHDVLPEHETVAIYIEYIFSKYRVIIEYTLKILDMIVQYKDSNKKLKDYELYNMKLDYLKDLSNSDKRKSILNTAWFQSIRKTRNSIIHNGATCVVYENKEKLFQVYDLNEKELVTDGYYIHKGNCIYFDYFISLNISYLIYFIDSIFSVVLEELGYVENIDPMQKSIIENSLHTVFDKQQAIMQLVRHLLDEADSTKQ